MPKKTAEEQYESFLAEVLETIPTDRREAVEGVLKDTALAPKIRERVLARSDYSREMDSLREARTALDGEVAEARTRIKGWEDWYSTTSQEHATLQDRVKAYETAYGDLEDGEGKPRDDAKKYFTQDEIAAELQRRDQMAIRFADVLTDLKIEHREQFGEKLNTNELIKYAGERGLPLEAAYTAFVSDKVEAKRKDAHDKALAAAREEGAREALSKHNLPMAPRALEPHALDRPEVKTDERDRVAAAVTHFRSSNRGAQ